MSQNAYPRRGLAVAAGTGALVALSLWLVAATQLPNAAEQRNAMITELQKVNQHLTASDKRAEALQKKLVEVERHLAEISKNTK